MFILTQSQKYLELWNHWDFLSLQKSFILFFSYSSHHNGIKRVLHSAFRGSTSAHPALLWLGRLYKGQKILISALLLKGDKVGRRGVSEGYLSAEEADNPCAVSWREQPCAVSRKDQLLSGQYLLRGRKMAYVNAAPDEKSTSAVLENLLARNSSAQAKFPLFRLQF